MTKNIGDMIFETMTVIDDERKTTCIECGLEWYEIHMPDGICNQCVQKGVPGRSKREKSARNVGYFFICVFVVLSFMVYKIVSIFNTAFS